MKILSNMGIIDLALYFDSTLVIADIHIGYEEVLNRQGILVPRTQFEEMAKRFEKIIKSHKYKKIDRIIVNGDLKHEFGTISEQEWRNALKFLDLLAKYCKEIILIKGNHDTILGPIANKRNVKVLGSVVVGKFLITHGDKIPDKGLLKKASTIIIGHEHPAISLKEGARVEKYKCFLKGKYKGKNLIVQPSFNTLIEGTDILRDEMLSPFLEQNLDSFEVYAVEDKVYDFGKLGNLRNRA
ncbi:metallophosphoesterase [Candidatus Woesearchaeota archaeon]|nr:metallophosphoesterase [Candidatus Woesearchaeota archaeon]